MPGPDILMRPVHFIWLSSSGLNARISPYAPRYFKADTNQYSALSRAQAGHVRGTVRVHVHVHNIVCLHARLRRTTHHAELSAFAHWLAMPSPEPAGPGRRGNG